MSNRNSSTEMMAVKDESTERPIPMVWRPVLREIVNSFVARDYPLNIGVAGVDPVSDRTAVHIENYIRTVNAREL